MKAPPNAFLGLRAQLFSGSIIARPDPRVEIHGVAMEAHVDKGSYLVFGLLDGSASMYLSSGGGFIGGQGKPHINAAARRLVEVARPWARKLPLTDSHPLPPAGRVRFSLLTPAGVRAVEVDEGALVDGEGELTPVFAAAQDIITGFRLASSREPADEAAYVKCLLVALARGHGRSARLAESSPPPDPTRLTTNREDLEWIAGIGFQLDALDTGKIVRTLLDLAGFRWYRFGMSEGRIQVKLATGDRTPIDVAFLVQRRQGGGAAEIHVALDRASA